MTMPELARATMLVGIFGDVFLHMTEEGVINVVSEYEIERQGDITVMSI